jgi:uncharacterized protein (DUF885 family)
LSLELLTRNYSLDIEAYELGWYFVPLTHLDGIQVVHQLSDSLRFETEKDFEDWLARLDTFPAYLHQTIDLMKLGRETGRLLPQIVMQRVVSQISRQIVSDPRDSPFFRPFLRLPAAMEEATRHRLAARAEELIRRNIVPGFRVLESFYNEEYLPACYRKVGIWQVPGGAAIYRHRVRYFTSSDSTPEEIHQLGLKEVARIRDEMAKIMGELGFEGSFQDFLQFLRTDPQFYYDDPRALLTSYRELCKRIDPTLVKLFGVIPRLPYAVEPIREEIAPDTTTAFYLEPAADGSRPGIYYVNLYRPEVRPKYEMEALSLHEAVPGHHFQIALAMELQNLPAFRRYGSYTVFDEGWALYAESLGTELGFYKDPYSKFGQLTYEMWRAVRLVVDTGMHARQWSRQKAIDYFLENAAKTKLDVVNEIDRYVSWPAQALAYKIGELKIKELRSRAEAQLGSRFDVRAFHDMLLQDGSIPLDVLEKKVNDWTAGYRQSKPGN